MTDRAIVRGCEVLTCSPSDPDAINAAIAAVRADVEAEHGPGGDWQATYDPIGSMADPTPNVLTWAYYTAGGGPTE